jgi:hypothetical protein
LETTGNQYFQELTLLNFTTCPILHVSRLSPIVIGAVYNPKNSFVDGWWYFLSWVDIPQSPWLVGESDGDCWHESQIRALSQ